MPTGATELCGRWSGNKQRHTSRRLRNQRQTDPGCRLAQQSDDGEMVISAGNVGIGTTAPLSKLHILSAVGAPAPRLQSPPGGTGSVAAGWDFYVGETRKGYVGVGNESVGFGAGELLLLGGTGNKTSLWAGYNRGVTVDTNGNVGIGTSGPGFKLDVAGRAHATSFLNSSDDRLKTNIAPLTNVVERIRKIRGLSFWNEKYAALGGSSNKREFGVLANEVKEVFPELVSTWRDENYLAVDYGRLTAVLLEAAKELSSEIEVLNGRIDALEKPTKELGRKSNE